MTIGIFDVSLNVYFTISYVVMITVSFPDSSLIACVTSSYNIIYAKPATMFDKATSYESQLCLPTTQILCKCLVCTSSYAGIHKYNQELPAMDFVAFGYGYEVYPSPSKY